MTKDKALKMAKETLTKWGTADDELACAIVQTVRAIDEALEQPAQELAYQVGEIVNPYGSNIKIKQPAQEPVYIVKQNGNCTMQLKSKDWVGLSLPDIEALYKQSDSISLYAFTQDVRAIEQALKEKNHG